MMPLDPGLPRRDSPTLVFWHHRRVWHVDGRFTRKQARRLLDGKVADLSYPMAGQNPYLWQKHDEAVLIPAVFQIVITNVQGDKGVWNVTYRIEDHRPRLLARSIGYDDQLGRGYTDEGGKAIGSSDRALPGNLHSEPEAIDPEKIGLTRSDYTHRERVTDELPKEAARRREREEINRLRNAKRQAEAKGISTKELDIAIERELRKLEEMLREAA